MYAKLFARVTDSSLMEESIPVRYTFIMLLAVADQEGCVIGTDVALSRRLNIPLDEFRQCVERLGKPDPDSNSKELDGVRLVKSEGERGYQIVNYVKYRNIKGQDDKREYMRNYMRERRKSQQNNGFVKLVNSPLTVLADVTHTDTDTEGGESASPPAPAIEKTKSMLPEMQEVFDAWNLLTGFPRCLLISDKRRRQLEARLRDPFFSANWRAGLAKLPASNFLRGQTDRGSWKANFDWFIQPDSLAKILEGKYDNNENPHSNPASNDRNAVMSQGTNHRTAADFIRMRNDGSLERERADRLAATIEAERISAAGGPVAGQVASVVGNSPAAGGGVQ